MYQLIAQWHGWNLTPNRTIAVLAHEVEYFLQTGYGKPDIRLFCAMHNLV